MAFAYLTPAAGYSGGNYGSPYTTPLTYTATNAAPVGSLITVAVWFYNNDLATGATVSDNASGSPNAYGLVQSLRNAISATANLLIYRCYNVRGSPTTWMVTLAGGAYNSSTSLGFNVDVFTGALTTADPLDGSAINGQTSVGSGTDNIVSGSFTPTHSGDLIVCYDRQTGGYDATVGTGFTKGQDANTGPSGIATEYNLAGSSGSQQGTWNGVTTQSVITGAMAFIALPSPVVFVDEQTSQHARFMRAWPGRTTDPDLVRPFIHPPWQPYAFDDQDSPNNRNQWSVFRRRHNDPDLAGPYPQWVKYAYDETPVPPRPVYRARTNDPDLVRPFIHPPWQPYVFDDQDSLRHQRVPPAAQRGDPDADVGTAPTRVIPEDAQVPRRLPRPVRQSDPPPDVVSVVIAAPVVTEDQPPGPRRLIMRARTNDPDVARAAVTVAPAVIVVFDEPLGPRRELVRARAADPDIVVGRPPAPPTAVIFAEDVGPFARRFLWHRPLTDPDPIKPLAPRWRPFVFDEQDNPHPAGRFRAYFQGRRGDEDILYEVITIAPAFSPEADLCQLIESQPAFYFSGGFGSLVNKAAFAVRVATGEDLPLYVTDQTLQAPLLAAPAGRQVLPPDTTRGPRWDVAIVGSFLFDFSQTIAADDDIAIAFVTVSSKSTVLSEFIAVVTVSPVSGIPRQAAWCLMNPQADSYRCVIASAAGITKSSTITVTAAGMFVIGQLPRGIAGSGQFYLLTC